MIYFLLWVRSCPVHILATNSQLYFSFLYLSSFLVTHNPISTHIFCELTKSKEGSGADLGCFDRRKLFAVLFLCTSRLFWMKSAHVIFMVCRCTMLNLSLCHFRQMASRLKLPVPTWPVPSSKPLWLWLLLWHAFHSHWPLLARSLPWHRISHRKQNLVLCAAGRHCCPHSYLGETVSLDRSSLVLHPLFDSFYFSAGLLLVLQLHVSSVLGLPPPTTARHHWAAHEGRASWFHHGEGGNIIYGKVKVIYNWQKKKNPWILLDLRQYFQERSVLQT